MTTDEVDTIGGYLSMEAGHVPAPGESFTLRGWTFTVLEADRKLILRLRMEPASSAASRSDAEIGTTHEADQASAAATACAQDEQATLGAKATAIVDDIHSTMAQSAQANALTETDAVRPADSPARV